MKEWILRHRETVLDMGRFLQVERHEVVLPDGRTIDNWPWVVTPDYVNIVAVADDERFLCLRQTKYAADGPTLAIVGGYLDAGEDPLTGARRELLEETGYVASRWTKLGRYAVDGNRGAGHAHLYLAEEAGPADDVRAASAHSDDLEEQEVVWLNRSELVAALTQGAFKVLAWPAALALALVHHEQQAPADSD